MQRIFTELKSENVPMIMYGVGASHLAKDWHDLPLDVVGLDWRMSVDEARKEGLTKTLQETLIQLFYLLLGKSLKREQKIF